MPNTPALISRGITGMVTREEDAVEHLLVAKLRPAGVFAERGKRTPVTGSPPELFSGLDR